MNILNPVPRASVATVACALCVASATTLANPKVSDEELKDFVEALKTAYLWCDHAAASRRLSSADIMRCSVIYEELKQRAFGGDFERLLAWSRDSASVRPTHK